MTYAPGLLYKRAKREQADFYSAHLEAGFIAGGELVRSGKKVGFDLEDWYSRDYMTADRAIDLLHRAEGFALSHGRFFTTTSESMARGISEVWKSQNPITVIYNSFPDEDMTNPVGIDNHGNDNKPFRLLWTSRSVGSGRGIETLLKALTYLEMPVEVHLVGQLAKGYREFLQQHWPGSQGHRLCLVEFMPHRELSALIPGFDLGLAIENNFPDNKDRTISNKILQYIQAGIKVLATDTKGQVEVADDFPESVFLVPVDQPERWASQIRKAIQQRRQHEKDKQADRYRKKFAWPAQEEKLKQLITQHI